MLLPDAFSHPRYSVLNFDDGLIVVKFFPTRPCHSKKAHGTGSDYIHENDNQADFLRTLAA